jgi:DNA segregation ATPase FtsK/SpoIIIE, S-DNA-T family
MDSRIVLDQKGGELLLGQGDMLYLSPRSHKLTRAQGTLVDDSEIRKVVKFMRTIATPTFERQLVQLRSAGAGPSEEEMRDGFANAQEDPLFDKAVEIVLETKLGSVSMLQRRLAIGYTRAARLVEMMGEAGILGAHKGTVAREVMMTIEEWHALKAQAEADAQAASAGDNGGSGDLFDSGGGTATAAPAAPKLDRPSLNDVIEGTADDEDAFEDAFQEDEADERPERGSRRRGKGDDDDEDDVI